nr:MAG TPA_asm: hypothetical protein [Caudoviricetes sp.]
MHHLRMRHARLRCRGHICLPRHRLPLMFS